MTQSSPTSPTSPPTYPFPLGHGAFGRLPSRPRPRRTGAGGVWGVDSTEPNLFLRSQGRGAFRAFTPPTIDALNALCPTPRKKRKDADVHENASVLFLFIVLLLGNNRLPPRTPRRRSPARFVVVAITLPCYTLARASPTSLGLHGSLLATLASTYGLRETPR